MDAENGKKWIKLFHSRLVYAIENFGYVREKARSTPPMCTCDIKFSHFFENNII